MRWLLTGSAIRTVLVILAVGIFLGAAAAFRSFTAREPVPEELQPPGEGETRPAFAAYFIHFFPGRTHDGTRPRPKSPLLRASKFLAGERVGLRVQTAPERQGTFAAEIRFLSRATNEEMPALRNDRQTFRIRSGIRTYCCLRIPREPGDYNLGVLVEGQYLAFLPVNVKEPPRRTEGGLFAPAEE